MELPYEEGRKPRKNGSTKEIGRNQIQFYSFVQALVELKLQGGAYKGIDRVLSQKFWEEDL